MRLQIFFHFLANCYYQLNFSFKNLSTGLQSRESHYSYWFDQCLWFERFFVGKPNARKICYNQNGDPVFKQKFHDFIVSNLLDKDTVVVMVESKSDPKMQKEDDLDDN